MLHRYHTLDFIKNMDLEEFCSFLILAINQDKKEKAYLQYISLLPYFMQAGKYMSFDKFYDQLTGANIDWRSAEEMLREAEEIQRKQSHGNGNL